MNIDRLTKKQREEALNIVTAWRGQGVPDWVTGYEAYRLTGGFVGKLRDSSPHELTEVAVKYVRLVY